MSPDERCDPTAGGEPASRRNLLGGEKSPYLLQHRDNPVWWRPWGAEAFEAARREDKPVFLSVGYSTCHWCHVMAHESFEDDAVAGALNEHFVAVKVDREERPDVDDIYMTAVQAMTGQGGWPMSVWLTPEGKPFFGGTYYPRHAFLEILARLAAAWRSDRGRVEQVGRDLASALAAHDAAERGGGITDNALTGYLRSFEAVFDPVHGARRGAPKFPPAADLRLLLRIHRRSGEPSALEMAKTTLDRMAAGGIFDHLGGGFHRYATDERWLVPHFEKMLYDQAALTAAYTEAWQVTGHEEYARVVRETIEYVLRDLTHADGGFLSAEDADSEGEEGRFYVWTERELRERLSGTQFTAVASAWGVTSRGNFESGTNILHLQPGHSRAGRDADLEAARRTLFEARERRVRPHLDDKVLTSWNGLMISAMARAGRAFGEPGWVEAARRAARFVLERLRGEDGRLLRRWRDGEARFPAYLNDYAFLIDGLIEIHQADFDPEWIRRARALQEIQDLVFADASGGGYHFTDGADPTLLKRGRVFTDNVRPAGNSVSALNLLRLSALLGEQESLERARAVMAAASGSVDKFPMAFPFLLMAADYSLDRSKEIALVAPGPARRPGGPDGALDAMLAAVGVAGAAFRPNQVVAVSTEGDDEDVTLPLSRGRGAEGGIVTAWICEHGACRRPLTDPGEAAEAAGEIRPIGAAGS